MTVEQILDRIQRDGLRKVTGDTPHKTLGRDLLEAARSDQYPGLRRLEGSPATYAFTPAT